MTLSLASLFVNLGVKGGKRVKGGNEEEKETVPPICDSEQLLNYTS